MSLRFSYTLIAPIYDLFVSRLTNPLRQQSLQSLGDVNGKQILIPGIGTGLDLPYLPQGAHYTGLDLTPAMLKRAELQKPKSLDIRFDVGNLLHMDYPDNQFDGVVMHLILAVVPDPVRALQEVSRVTNPGGRILILDKFLQPGNRAWMRKLLNPLISRIATRTDVVFEEVLAQCPQLNIQRDEPMALSGWFRNIELIKQ